MVKCKQCFGVHPKALTHGPDAIVTCAGAEGWSIGVYRLGAEGALTPLSHGRAKLL